MTRIMTLYGSLVSPSLTASSASLWAGPAPLFTISHLLVSLLLVIGYFNEMLHGEVKTQDIATMGKWSPTATIRDAYAHGTDVPDHGRPWWRSGSRRRTRRS